MTASRDVLLLGFGLLGSGLVLIIGAVFARARPVSDPVPTGVPGPRRGRRRTRAWRGRRGMARDLPDPALWHTVDAALSCLPADEPARAAAVLVGRDTVSVRFAGHRPSTPVPPWQERSDGWSALRDRLAQEVAGNPRAAGASDTFVAIGRTGQRTVLLDLAQVPGVLAVGGEPRAATTFFEALLSQVESIGCHQLLVAAGTVQDAPEADVAELVRGLPSRRAAPAYPEGTHLTILACATPTEDEAVLLRQALIDRLWLRILILGEYQGTYVPLVVDRRGRVEAPATDLITNGSVLPRIAPQRSRAHRQEPKRAPVVRRTPDAVPPAQAIPPIPPPPSLPVIVGAAQEFRVPVRPASAPGPRPKAPAIPAALAPLPSRDPALSTDPLARRPKPTGVSAGPRDVAREPEH